MVAAEVFKINFLSNKLGGQLTKTHQLHFPEMVLINLVKIRNILLSKCKVIRYTNSKIQLTWPCV